MLKSARVCWTSPLGQIGCWAPSPAKPGMEPCTCFRSGLSFQPSAPCASQSRRTSAGRYPLLPPTASRPRPATLAVCVSLSAALGCTRRHRAEYGALGHPVAGSECGRRGTRTLTIAQHGPRLFCSTIKSGFTPRRSFRSVRNQEAFDSGSESSRSLKPHRHLSSGIRPTEQTSWLSSRPYRFEQFDARVRRIKSETGAMHNICESHSWSQMSLLLRLGTEPST
jgi:hypothetical protein